MCFEQIMEVLKNNSAIISALAALIAIGFSFFVWFHTRKLLKPTERPILSLINAESDDTKISEPERMIGYQIRYKFKNIGKHPAKNLRIRSVLIRKDNLEIVKKETETKIANRIDPDNEFNYRTSTIRLEVKQGKAVVNKREMFIYLLLDYDDWYNSKKHQRDELWFCYMEGDLQPILATIEEKEIIESIVTELIPNREKLKNINY